MERTACVDIPGLALQLLFRVHPDWRTQPVVVVDRDAPQGTIQWCNDQARSHGVLPGMRYAAGLALCRDLHGGSVAPAEVAHGLAEITACLWNFSPRVEPCAQEPGVFWLDARGLAFLYPDLERWSGAIQENLKELGFTAAVVVGFSRFGTYAVARSHPDSIHCLPGPEIETAKVRDTPLSHLGIAPSLAETLHKLGISTVGGFMDFPVGEVAKRFGPEAAAFHRFARGESWAPLQPLPIPEPLTATVLLDYPEIQTEGLLALVAGRLEPLLAALEARHEQLVALGLDLRLDNKERREERITPAEATRDMNSLLGLLRLRLGALELPSGVVELRIELETKPREETQSLLFPEASEAGLAAAHRALARIRAEFGDGAVLRARLQEAHLPEARFRWERLAELKAPRPAQPLSLPLCRRIHTPPQPLPPRDNREPDGWLVAGIHEGPVEEVIGPHMVSGGWWVREACRAYYYVRTRSGRWLWIYYDQRRRRWFLQGEVE